MDIQNLLIYFVQGKCQDIVSRLSEVDLKKIIKQIDAQSSIYTKVIKKSMNDIENVPYANRYNSIKDIIINELNKRKVAAND
jgi:hypothetical protein